MTPQETSPLENLRRAVEQHRADELDRKLGPVATALVTEAFRRQASERGTLKLDAKESLRT